MLYPGKSTALPQISLNFRVNSFGYKLFLFFFLAVAVLHYVNPDGNLAPFLALHKVKHISPEVFGFVADFIESLMRRWRRFTMQKCK